MISDGGRDLGRLPAVLRQPARVSGLRTVDDAKPVSGYLGSCPSTWWKFGLAEVVADHAAWVEIWVDTASLVGGVSSAIGSVCI